MDTSIAMGFKPPQLESPLNALAQVMQLRQGDNQNALAQLTLDKNRREQEQETSLADVYKTSLGADGKLDRDRLLHETARRGLGSKIPGLQKSFLEQDEAQGNVAKQKVELVDAKLKQSRKYLDTVKTPEQYIQWHLGNHADPVLGPELAARGVTAEQSIAAIQKALSMPGGFEELLQKSALGIEKFTELNKPTVHMQDVGGTSNVLSTPGMGGAPVVLSSTAKTQTPDSAANTKLGYARLGEEKRHHGVTEEQGATTVRLKKQELENDKGGGGPVLGVPLPTVTPWANQTNPKDANKVRAAEAARGAKEIEKDADAARAAAATAADAKRFIELNKKNKTGGVVDKFGVGRFAQSFGSEYAELESITAKLVPAMRQPGSGSTSDRDLATFERATVGVDKPGKTNQNIANGIIARAEQLQDYADFRQTYLEQNGTLQGADRHWKDYVNKNPIFAEKTDSFELNPKRKTWAEHFKGGKPKEAAPAEGGGLSVAEQTELQELRKRLGK
jgi:hypothetical protein